jgi:hypothetical protein
MEAWQTTRALTRSVFELTAAGAASFQRMNFRLNAENAERVEVGALLFSSAHNFQGAMV